MSYTYLNNIPLENALETYIEELSKVNIFLSSEEIPVQQAYGRITSEAVYARISSPHYNASAMDGIAVRAAQTFGATDTTPVILTEGIDFVWVDTGDALPDTCDAVVMVEDVIEIDQGKVKLISAAAPWQHIRQIGEDICQGEMILASNTRIVPSALGALLAGGVLGVKVWKRPLVGLIPTGDEIIKPTSSPEKGKIIEFNSAIFSGMLAEWGAESKTYAIVPDRLELLKSAIGKAAEECDVIIVNAGSSAGRDDYASKAIEDLGSVAVHGVSIKPGKPAILGIVDNKPVIGVPGYPVSGIIVMEKLVKPVLNAFTMISFIEAVRAEAILSRKIVSSLKYREFVRVRLGKVGDKLIATPLNRGAGVVTSFVKADGLMDIPMDTEGIDAGSKVNVQLLKSMETINNTLVITGSHDPLIDIIADIMNRNRGSYLASSHVGSLGGIMALKRSEAHLAGIHLLDETTGEYNTAYIRKYFQGENIALIKGVKRIQGLMVKPGNPKNITGIRDLNQKGISYVNRQKGAGTRILLDYLLKRESMDPAGIYGYEREEYTHMSVAALVAADSADCGLGIYSAAGIYNLDFIPICEEEYDFIIRENDIELDMVQKFLQVLRSEEFIKSLKEMGGYVTEGAGEIVRNDTISR